MDPEPARRPSFEVVAETPSTNSLAADRAREGAPEGLVVVAEHQTAGRGRLDRTWETPPGTAVTFSVLLRPTVPAASWPWLPLVAGYAAATALAGLGYRAEVKWPNDVLIGERKVGGILVERVDTPAGAAAVVGIGINTGMTEEQLPVPTATSLSLEQGPDETPDRDAVLEAVVTALLERYDAWQRDPTSLADAYADACTTVGRRVRVDLPDGGALEGEAVGVDASGRLVVQAPDGTRHEVGAGDVVHVRSVAPGE